MASNTAPPGASTTSSSEVSLESWLWGAACSIRGAKDAPKYKDFILPLVFAKRLCDVFDDEVDRIAEQVGSRAKAFELLGHDKQLVRFYLPFQPADPDEPVWTVIRTLADKIGEQLTTYLREIGEANPSLKGIIDRVDFNATTHGQRDLDDDRLSNLIEAISAKSLGLNDVEPDIIGRSYEFLIRKFAEGSGQSAGEFYTPAAVGFAIARIMDPKPGMDIYDPCAGSGGLLIKCRLVAQEGEALEGAAEPIQLFGQESEPGTWAMANMNMIIHDMDGQMELGDSFRDPKFRAGNALRRFDRIVANPMWNQDWFSENDYDADPFARFTFGVPPDSTADWGWVQHMLASVKDDGRIAVVLDTAAVSRGSGAKGKNKERDIRKQIVEAGLVEAVVLLPENLFYNTGAPGIIMILNRGGKPDDPIRLVNASRLFVKGQPKNYLTDEHVATIVNAVKADADIEDLCRVLSVGTVAEIDFDLSPRRHVPLDPDVPALPLDEGVAAATEAEAKLAIAHADAQRLLGQFRACGGDGDLPAGWHRKTLASLVAEKISGDWGSEHPTEGGGWLRCAVIRGTDFPAVSRARFADVPVRYISERSVEKRRPEDGDIIVEISGGGKYQNTGRAIYVTSELIEAANDPVLFTNFTKLLRVDIATVRPKYFFYQWVHLYDLGRTARYEKQPTNIKNFKLEDFLSSETIAYPEDLEAQDRIVAALDAIHEELGAIENDRNSVLAVRHSALRELLSGGYRDEGAGESKR